MSPDQFSTTCAILHDDFFLVDLQHLPFIKKNGYWKRRAIGRFVYLIAAFPISRTTIKCQLSVSEVQ